MIELLIAAGIEIVRAIRAGIKANAIPPANLEALEAEMDGLRKDRKTAMDAWNSTNPDNPT